MESSVSPATLTLTLSTGMYPMITNRMIKKTYLPLSTKETLLS
jgi:hypothetical protein